MTRSFTAHDRRLDKTLLSDIDLDFTRKRVDALQDEAVDLGEHGASIVEAYGGLLESISTLLRSYTSFCGILCYMGLCFVLPAGSTKGEMP